MTCMNLLSRAFVTRHGTRSERANLSQDGPPPIESLCLGPSQARYAPLQSQSSRRPFENGHVRSKAAKSSHMSSPANSSLFMWRRGTRMDMRVGSALVRCFFFGRLQPLGPPFCIPKVCTQRAGGRASPLVIPSTNINCSQKQTRGWCLLNFG